MSGVLSLVCLCRQTEGIKLQLRSYTSFIVCLPPHVRVIAYTCKQQVLHLSWKMQSPEVGIFCLNTVVHGGGGLAHVYIFYRVDR